MKVHLFLFFSPLQSYLYVLVGIQSSSYKRLEVLQGKRLHYQDLALGDLGGSYPRRVLQLQLEESFFSPDLHLRVDGAVRENIELASVFIRQYTAIVLTFRPANKVYLAERLVSIAVWATLPRGTRVVGQFLLDWPLSIGILDPVRLQLEDVFVVFVVVANDSLSQLHSILVIVHQVIAYLNENKVRTNKQRSHTESIHFLFSEISSHVEEGQWAIDLCLVFSNTAKFSKFRPKSLNPSLEK